MDILWAIIESIGRRKTGAATENQKHDIWKATEICSVYIASIERRK